MRCSTSATTRSPRTCASSPSTCSPIASPWTRVPAPSGAARRRSGCCARSWTAFRSRSRDGRAWRADRRSRRPPAAPRAARRRRARAPPAALAAAAAHAPPDAGRLGLLRAHARCGPRRAQHRQQPDVHGALAPAVLPGAVGRAVGVRTARRPRAATAPRGAGGRAGGDRRDRGVQPAASGALLRGGRRGRDPERGLPAWRRPRVRTAGGARLDGDPQLPLRAARTRHARVRRVSRRDALPVRAVLQGALARGASPSPCVPGARSAAPGRTLRQRGPPRGLARGRGGPEPGVGGAPRLCARRRGAARPLARVIPPRPPAGARAGAGVHGRDRRPSAHRRREQRPGLRGRRAAGRLRGRGEPAQRPAGQPAYRFAVVSAGRGREPAAPPPRAPGADRSAGNGGVGCGPRRHRGPRVSRLEFRLAVDAPRPRSALAMVGLASATLAITGHLAFWALGLAGAALAWSTLRRTRPAAWQRRRWLLNLGLAASVAAAALVEAEVGAMLVALAHFAVLAQGLQLLDARPRHTEFLLVALAIFQVTLAANLTDSLL